MTNSEIIERQQELLRESEQRRVSSDIRWGAEVARLRAERDTERANTAMLTREVDRLHEEYGGDRHACEAFEDKILTLRTDLEAVTRERDEARKGYHALDGNWSTLHETTMGAIRASTVDGTVPEIVEYVDALRADLAEKTAEVDRLRGLLNCDVPALIVEGEYEVGVEVARAGSTGCGECEACRAALAEDGGEKKPRRRVTPEEIEVMHAVLHPNGRCTCCGEGECDWCRKTEVSLAAAEDGGSDEPSI